ncbi:restriction endonuclease subunit S [Pseudomonas sp. W2-17]|uniref:restriction endonuclease subunit S n=1 Tax=Pseudomonas sp. W2-17 TaxID=3058039 RepID=UPI0034E079A4
MMKLNEVFDVSYGNKFDLNKMQLLPVGSGGVSFVSRSEKNHGVSATVARVNGVVPYPAGLITVALGGTKLLCSFVQERPFYTAQNVAVLKPIGPMTFSEKVFTCICIRANRFRYGAFGREANRTLRFLEIPSLSEFPDFVHAHAGSISESLENVLLQIEALSSVETQVPSSSETLVKVSDLFAVNYGHSLELNRLVSHPGGVNYISRTARNNGVSAQVLPIPNLLPSPGGCLTVALSGSVLETFYQTEPFYSGYHIQTLTPLQDMTPEEMLFYASVIRANRYRYSYGRQANRTLRDLLIPAKEAIPSWVYGSCRRVVDSIRAQSL